MPAQIPNLSANEQQQLLKEIRYETLYPYTYRINKTVNATNFPGVLTGGRAFVYTFTAPNALALIAFQTSLIIFPTSTEYFGIFLSYTGGGSNLSIADNSVVTQPDDSGNFVFTRIFSGSSNINDFIFFMPQNYYLAKGQSIFIYGFADSAAILAASSAMIGSFTIHTRPTGLQV